MEVLTIGQFLEEYLKQEMLIGKCLIKEKGIGFNYRYDNFSRIKSRMSQYSFNSSINFIKIIRKIDCSRLNIGLDIFGEQKQFIIIIL